MRTGLKTVVFGSIASIPVLFLVFWFLNPPQCPVEYTQEQIDGSRCIVGANIGGMPLFMITAPFVWLLVVWATKKFLASRADKTKKRKR